MDGWVNTYIVKQWCWSLVSPADRVGIRDRLNLLFYGWHEWVPVAGVEEVIDGISPVIKRRLIPDFAGWAPVGHGLAVFYFGAEFVLRKQHFAKVLLVRCLLCRHVLLCFGPHAKGFSALLHVLWLCNCNVATIVSFLGFFFLFIFGLVRRVGVPGKLVEG